MDLLTPLEKFFLTRFFHSPERLVSYINPFAPEPPVTARADPGPFYPL